MNILGFGEVLWDVFPEKRVIGGAPFNFCAHAVKLGAKADFISAVGHDELGMETRERLVGLGVGDRFLASVNAPTGICLVTLDSGGSPSYELRRGVAYDFITAPTEVINAINVKKYDAFYLGTLAARDKVSREALKAILSNCSFRDVIFDVNIRQHFYDDDILKIGLHACSILKLSRDEIQILSKLVKGDIENEEGLCRALAEQYDIRDILLTLDKDGAMIYSDGKIFNEPNPQSQVISTVGGGDSFTAAYTFFRLSGKKPGECLKRALILSSYVVSKTEAIPDYNDDLRSKLFE